MSNRSISTGAKRAGSSVQSRKLTPTFGGGTSFSASDRIGFTLGKPGAAGSPFMVESIPALPGSG